MDRSEQKVLRGLEIKSGFGDVRLSTSVIDGQTCLRTDEPNLMIEKLRF